MSHRLGVRGSGSVARRCSLSNNEPAPIDCIGNQFLGGIFGCLSSKRASQRQETATLMNISLVSCSPCITASCRAVKIPTFVKTLHDNKQTWHPTVRSPTIIGYIRVKLELYWDNGKENGNCNNGILNYDNLLSVITTELILTWVKPLGIPGLRA